MKFTLTINCDNAAFEYCPSVEVASILKHVSERVYMNPNFSAGHSQPIRDLNGNTVGSFDITE